MTTSTELPSIGSQWRRKSDGRIDEVVACDIRHATLYSPITKRRWSIEIWGLHRKYTLVSSEGALCVGPHHWVPDAKYPEASHCTECGDITETAKLVQRLNELARSKEQ